jgi:chromosomal replication initiation ATPase DnaA
MKHDPMLANDLIIRSLLAKIEKLEARTGKLEAEVTTLRRSKTRRKPQSARRSGTTPKVAAIVAPIVEQAAKLNGTTVAEIYGDRGSRRACLARAEACYECRRAGLSSPVIGRAIGNRDHSNVLRLIGRHKDRMGIK